MQPVWARENDAGDVCVRRDGPVDQRADVLAPPKVQRADGVPECGQSSEWVVFAMGIGVEHSNARMFAPRCSDAFLPGGVLQKPHR